MPDKNRKQRKVLWRQGEPTRTCYKCQNTFEVADCPAWWERDICRSCYKAVQSALRKNPTHKQWEKRYYRSSYRRFIMRLIKGHKIDDKDRKREYNLDLEYVLELLELQGYRCALSGVRMTHQNGDLRSVSIDRIDSSLGHVKGNVQLTCRLFNIGKSNKSNDQVHSIIQEIEMNLLKRLKAMNKLSL